MWRNVTTRYYGFSTRKTFLRERMVILKEFMLKIRITPKLASSKKSSFNRVLDKISKTKTL